MLSHQTGLTGKGKAVPVLN